MKKITLLIACFFAITMSTYAQVSSYSFSHSVGTYTETTGAATLLPLVRADTYLSPAQTIGFTFNYAGVDYTQFKMSSNGFISLNMTGTSSLTGNDLSAANATSRPIIAPLWDDLDGATPPTSVAAYEVTGTAPNRVLTVEWRNWEWNYASGATPVISFQLKLYETTNVIDFVYRQEATAVNSGSASIGIGAATGSGAGSYLSVSNVTTPAVSSTTSTNNINTKPATGQVFTFTPPAACTGTPIAGSVTPASQDLLSGQTPTTLVGTGYSTGVSGITFQWEESADDVTYVDAVGGTGATTASYTPPAFAGTTIYYRLKVTCTNSTLSATTSGVVLNPCPVFTVPSLEDFTTYVPGCWQEADNGDLTAGPATFGSSSWAADGFGNVGTTGAMKVNLDALGDNDWILSPLYTIPATGYELKFRAAATQFGSTAAPTTAWEADDFVEVLVSTGTTNWTILYTYDNSNVPSNTGSANILNLDAYSGQDVRFAFRGVEGATNGAADIDFSIDDFEIRLSPTCADISGLTASGVTGSAANMTWNVTTGNYEYVLDQIATDPAGSGTPIATESYNASSLSGLTTYYFHVRTVCAGPTYGEWSTVSFTTLLANDNFADAIALTCGQNVTGSTVSATLDEDDAPDGFGADLDAPNVWYSYTGSGSPETITINMCPSGYDTSFLVYTGTSGNLTLIGGNDDGGAANCPGNTTRSFGTFLSDGTTTYYITVEGWNFSSTGTYDLTLTCAPACTPAQANQDCANAIGVLVDGNATTVDNSCATVNAAQPTCDTFNSIADVWYSFVAPASGTVNVTATLGTATAAHMAVYSGVCGTLTSVGCSAADPTGSLTLTTLTGGNTYYLQLWNNGTEEGTFDVTLTDPSLSVETFDNNQFTYFPNPVKNTLTLRAQKEIQNVSIYNMLGQEVVKASPNTLESDLDMSLLQAGAYFVKVSIDNTVKTIRVIKQ